MLLPLKCHHFPKACMMLFTSFSVSSLLYLSARESCFMLWLPQAKCIAAVGRAGFV